MKKTVWTFGLIAGLIMSGMMALNVMAALRIGFDKAELIGYTTIIAAFLLIFFGVKSYRDNAPGRAITFRRAFLVGSLINVIACACYTTIWQFQYARIGPEFMERYAEHEIAQERAKGASEAQLTAKRAQMENFARLYDKRLVNIALTFLEPFPVGLIVSLISAGILRRRRDPTSGLPASHPSGAGAFV